MLKFVFAPLERNEKYKITKSVLGECVCPVWKYFDCSWNVLHYNESHCNIVATETALDHVIAHTEEPDENGEVTLGAFLDSEGAFHSTSFDIITKVAKWHGLGETTCRWIRSMLGGGKIIAVLTENAGGFCVQGLSAGRRAITSVVETGCGQTHKNTR